MVPAPFDYRRAETLNEALSLLAEHGDEAKVLAGGHSLVPAMKLRLARPKVIIDIGRLGEIRYIRAVDGQVAVGALTTHFEIESSSLLRDKCPLLVEVAPHIGDVQVRNKGTIGGSLAHADPAGDWPAAMLALDAELELASRRGRRVVKAEEFFVGVLQTALRPDELLCEIRMPVTGTAVSYVKFAQKASGFAVAGVAARVDRPASRVSVGITGVAPTPYRARAVETALQGKPLTSLAIAAAAALAAQGIAPLGDLHASEEFRGHLARVLTQRALTRAAGR